MSKSKIVEMRNLVRRAEKAEAKLTKREIENIENGRKAREILSIIETKIARVSDMIAEAYVNVPTEEVDLILDDFMNKLDDLLEAYVEKNTTQKRTRSKVKSTRSKKENEESVDQNMYQNDHSVETNIDENNELSEQIPTNDYEIKQEDYSQPTDNLYQTSLTGNEYQSGGIRYDVQ